MLRKSLRVARASASVNALALTDHESTKSASLDLELIQVHVQKIAECCVESRSLTITKNSHTNLFHFVPNRSFFTELLDDIWVVGCGWSSIILSLSSTPPVLSLELVATLTLLAMPRQRYYTPYEVSQHNDQKDIWVSYLGKVYDLTALCREHQGKPVSTDLSQKMLIIEGVPPETGVKLKEHLNIFSTSSWSSGDNPILISPVYWPRLFQGNGPIPVAALALVLIYIFHCVALLLLRFPGDVLMKPIIQAAGTDISHWFDKKTMDVGTRDEQHE